MSNHKNSPSTVEISLVLNAADDMFRGSQVTKDGTLLFHKYFFGKYGYKAVFKEDSVYTFIESKLKSQKKYPLENYFEGWARIVLSKNGVRDTAYIGFQPHRKLIYNQRLINFSAGLNDYIYKILMDKYDKKNFIIVGSEVNELCFKVATGMIFQPENDHD